MNLGQCASRLFRWALAGLSSNGVPIIYDVSPDGLSLTAFAGNTSVFVITLNPTAATYSVDMNAVVDVVTLVDFNDGAFNFVGGNDEWAGFIPVGETVAVPIDNNSQDLLLTPQLNHQYGGSINTNANEGGVGSGAMGVGPADETFRIDFVVDLRGDPQSRAAATTIPRASETTFLTVTTRSMELRPTLPPQVAATSTLPHSMTPMVITVL